ncbi:MAG TPA: NAD-dependent epimerase/dehydratase family protein, partial [Polyangiaceae bacterium LLY-WYZ-15_(1-7)]|nr:NAD-dependent epimerase/dehydratase family protein [Polyangiaceae bacterium LLY-WYZ-15_(1-7)]
MPASDAPVLVTGAAGHVGANLVHRLVGEGQRVRVLLRAEENNEAVEGLPRDLLEKSFGDLRDPGSLREAVKGCKGVYHVASMVSTIDGDAEHRRTIYDVNVLGTRHLLREAKEAGVERFVLTSSFSAVGYDLDQTDRPATEDMQFYPYHRAMPYERSKVLQEHELLKAVVEGFDALIVTSCAVVGGHDYLPSRMGRTLCKFANGELNAYVPGGFEFVAAQDIVAGHLLAMEKGRTGQKYVIATQFMTLDDIFDIFQELTGQPRPRFKLPSKVLLPVAEALSWSLYRLNPRFPQLLTPGAIRRLQLRRHAD